MLFTLLVLYYVLLHVNIVLCCISTSIFQDIDHFRYVLTEEAEGYVTAGSPEAQAFNAVPAQGGITLAALKVSLLSKLLE